MSIIHKSIYATKWVILKLSTEKDPSILGIYFWKNLTNNYLSLLHCICTLCVERKCFLLYICLRNYIGIYLIYRIDRITFSQCILIIMQAIYFAIISCCRSSCSKQSDQWQARNHWTWIPKKYRVLVYYLIKKNREEGEWCLQFRIQLTSFLVSILR